MANLKISVVMSTYNSADFLVETIDSVLCQTFKSFEFIIIDDASTDDSVKIIEKYEDPRIKLIKNNVNKGPALNANHGIEISRGEYIVRIDADDICLPDRFEKQALFLDNHPECSIVGSNAIVFGDVNMITNLPLSDEEIRCELLFHSCIIHPSVMMRKKDLLKYSIRYNESLRAALDYDLWVICKNKLKLSNIKEPLVKYRRHNHQISFNSKTLQNKNADVIRLNQLEDIGVYLLDNEKEIYLNFIHGKIPDNKESLLLLENIFIRIFKFNHDKKIYNQDFLYQNLSSKWYYICANKAKHFSKLSRLYSSSELKGNTNISKYKRFKLFLASAFSYK